ncbi:MAG: hypothetical protein L0H74_00245 [Brachybacterium sp.]|nr:hypothetical protein [Brachybacterium sp.]
MDLTDDHGSVQEARLARLIEPQPENGRDRPRIDWINEPKASSRQEEGRHA